MIGLVAIGTKPGKRKTSILLKIVCPMILQMLMISSLVWQNEAENSKHPKVFPGFSTYQLIYAVVSFLGAVILQMGVDNISKLMQQKMGRDRWNIEEESFDENQELVTSETTIIFQIFSVIEARATTLGLISIHLRNYGYRNIRKRKIFGSHQSCYKAMRAKGFCLCIYDFKFPGLAQIAYYHYLLKKRKDVDYDYQQS